MFPDLQMVNMSVRILRFMSLIYEHNWRRYVCMTLATFITFAQFYYMFRTTDGIQSIIKNSYALVLWFSTIVRGYLLLYDREKYEQFLNDLECLYYDLKKSKGKYIQDLLIEVNSRGKNIARGNMCLGFCTCMGLSFYPLLTPERVLPYGAMVPGIDEFQSPYYEFFYVYHVLVTFIGCCMYIPYTSLVVAFIMFGIVMCKVLQFRLKNLRHTRNDDLMLHKNIKQSIQYQLRIINYVTRVNDLTTYMFLVEFLAFGALLCALLFLLISVNTFAERLISCAYITMILAQIFALYWYANELREQSFAIATTAFETEWYTYPIPLQKHLLLIIMRAQKPPEITMGYTYPISLQLFQSLLNTSYTFFTLLRGVYV